MLLRQLLQTRSLLLNRRHLLNQLLHQLRLKDLLLRLGVEVQELDRMSKICRI